MPPVLTGALVLVGTPIGNLGDISPRAVDALTTADLIACEDTRRTRILLSALGVRAGRRLLSVHEHNEAARVDTVLARLGAGQTVAVVSDAGMPLVSDPGERLVAAAVEAGHRVEVVPGPSAVLAALVLSGMVSARFCFEGFLPRSGRARTKRLAELAPEPRTIVIFEAPQRVAATVADLASALGGDRRVAVARELTKRYEAVWRGTLTGASAHLTEAEPRGEFVLVIDGASPEVHDYSDEDIGAALAACLNDGVDKKSAVAKVSIDLGVAKRRAYQIAIDL